ncbi:MAG: DUF5107 domain-containing protein, partial [Lachnospiraceae bacterium]|nr:DUF5107 domain-containing protein [Lachnospiraceae bacterium]
FMPYKACGAIKNATEDLAVNLEAGDKGAVVTLYASKDFDSELKVTVYDENGREESSYVNLKATDTAILSFAGFDGSKEGTGVKILKKNEPVLEYTVKHAEPEIPKAADPMKAPEEVYSNEELFLCGTHLEQYRHATFRPEDYYLEGLKRDPEDIRINNAYGKLIYGKGRFEESIEYYKAAVKRSVRFNPNPYDCEPFFNLGLALKMTGKEAEAYDAFYKATWDGNFRGRGFFELALLECRQGNLEKALEFVNESLNNGLHNFKARTIKTAILRKLDRTAESAEFLGETLRLDPIDPGAMFERKLLFDDDSFTALMRADNEDYRDLSILYSSAGFMEEALEVLDLSPDKNEPMNHYYRFAFTGDAKCLSKAESSDSAYCFPNRIEDINVLSAAVKKGGKMAAYYLGCLYYDKREWEKARDLWESAAGEISLPTVHRNLSLVYYNKEHDPDKARKELETAFAMDKSDARIFFELDQLYKVTDMDVSFRLSKMEENSSLLEKRDDLYTEYITLLNADGQFSKAYNLIMGHKFHPWEGGEGKITGAYKQALIGLAAGAGDKAAAKAYIEKAFSFPENLGEGKLIGELDNDLYFLMGEYSEDPSDKEKNYKLATRGEDNFTSAMYYNDQPPEMMYYRALAFNKLGNKDRAKKIADGMILYGKTHMNDEVKIDYFAVSLPDFLIFEADLNKKNRRHCENMINLGMTVRGTVMGSVLTR